MSETKRNELLKLARECKSPDDHDFLSSRDVELRLHGVIVKVFDEYYQVVQADSERGIPMVYLQEISGYKQGILVNSYIPANSVHLKYNLSDSIGFFEEGGIVYYAVRCPVRRNKIGLCTSNIRALFSGTNDERHFDRFPAGLVRTMGREFPNVAESLTKLGKSTCDLVLSKNFAIHAELDGKTAAIKSVELLYCNNSIGTISLKDMVVKLHHDYDHSMYHTKINKECQGVLKIDSLYG